MINTDFHVTYIKRNDTFYLYVGTHKIVAEHRQTKSAFTLERAMAGPAVAAKPAEQRNDVPLKVGDLVGFQKSSVG